MNLSEIEAKIKAEFEALREKLEHLFGSHPDVSKALDTAHDNVIEHVNSIPADDGTGLEAAPAILDGGAAAEAPQGDADPIPAMGGAKPATEA